MIADVQSSRAILEARSSPDAADSGSPVEESLHIQVTIDTEFAFLLIAQFIRQETPTSSRSRQTLPGTALSLSPGTPIRRLAFPGLQRGFRALKRSARVGCNEDECSRTEHSKKAAGRRQGAPARNSDRSVTPSAPRAAGMWERQDHPRS